MTKILTLPNNIEEYELNSNEVEVLILPKTFKRLDIKFAPALKKIIVFSPKLIIGPKEITNTTPVLNNAKSLNEIITFGDITFTTSVLGKVCAWTGVSEKPPVFTTIGYEALYEYSCFYYNMSVPIENIDKSLVYAYPEYKTCPFELAELYMKAAIGNPSSISEIKMNVLQKTQPVVK